MRTRVNRRANQSPPQSSGAPGKTVVDEVIESTGAAMPDIPNATGQNYEEKAEEIEPNLPVKREEEKE